MGNVVGCGSILGLEFVDGSVLEDVFEHLDTVILESFVNRAPVLTMMATIIGDVLNEALVLLILISVVLFNNVGGLCLTTCGVQEREYCNVKRSRSGV